MNTWRVINLAYHKEATTAKILKRTLSYMNNSTKIYMSFLVPGFFGSLYLYLTGNNLWIFISIGFELLLLLKLNDAKNKLVINELNAPEGKADLNNQSTRYLLFKEELQRKNIESNMVKERIDLVNIQIDMTLNRNNFLHKVSTVLAGIFFGMLTSQWNNVEDKLSLIAIPAAIALLALTFFLIASVFPSETEKAKEMKYFMLLYLKENIKTQKYISIPSA